MSRLIWIYSIFADSAIVVFSALQVKCILIDFTGNECASFGALVVLNSGRNGTAVYHTLSISLKTNQYRLRPGNKGVNVFPDSLMIS